MAHPFQFAVTLRDIAKAVGLSHSTVSRALDENPNISLSVRRMVQRTARQMGYHPNGVARALAHRRHVTSKRDFGAEIAWINFWSRPEDLRSFGEFELYWKGAYRAAEHYGYRLEEFNCGQDMSSSRLEKILVARNITGILVPPHRTLHKRADWRKIEWSRFHMVRLGYSVNLPGAHIVSANHLTMAMLAFEQIVKLGYQRIGYVEGQESTTRFKAGFLMKQMDIEAVHRVPIFSMTKGGMAASLLERWLKKYRPDAILTDVAELRGMLETLGFPVPSSIGLAVTSVLDGNADAGLDQSSQFVGEACVNTLISAITGRQVDVHASCQEVLIEGKWVHGSSLPRRH